MRLCPKVQEELGLDSPWPYWTSLHHSGSHQSHSQTGSNSGKTLAHWGRGFLQQKKKRQGRDNNLFSNQSFSSYKRRVCCNKACRWYAKLFRTIKSQAAESQKNIAILNWLKKKKIPKSVQKNSLNYIHKVMTSKLDIITWHRVQSHSQISEDIQC